MFYFIFNHLLEQVKYRYFILFFCIWNIFLKTTSFLLLYRTCPSRTHFLHLSSEGDSDASGAHGRLFEQFNTNRDPFSLFLQKRFPSNGHNGFPLPQTGHHLRANRWVRHPSPLPHTHHPNDDITEDYFRSTINMRIVNKFLLSSIRRSYNCGSGWRLVCAALSNRIDVYCTAR